MFGKFAILLYGNWSHLNGALDSTSSWIAEQNGNFSLVVARQSTVVDNVWV